MTSTSKSTKRFNFGLSRNYTAKRAGSNSLTISTNPADDSYSVGTSSLTMTVREATALQGFLNKNLIGGMGSSSSDTDI